MFFLLLAFFLIVEWDFGESFMNGGGILDEDIVV